MGVIYKPHPKQEELTEAALSFRYLAILFGGAAGGGKTYGSIPIFILLCKVFPGSKWVFVRQDFGKLKKTTIPSFFKVCPKGFLKKFVDGVAYFKNGSSIMFMGENYKQNKELTHFDGIEVNGFLLEECQDLNIKMFEKSKLRSGRNIIEPMPAPLIILTGNPSQNWSKDTFITPFKEGRLRKEYLFIQSLMEDNPSLPEVYKENLDTLDPITYARYVKGDWDVIDVEMPFAYAFLRRKHVKEFSAPLKNKYPLYLSFDFNVDPITCIVCQHSVTKIRIHDEFRLPNSDIYALCDHILAKYPGYYYIVTGDASGKHSTALVKDKLNYYTVIKQKLKLGEGQLKVPAANPGIKNNRILTNSILSRHPDIYIHPRCKYTIEDLQYVEVNTYGEIDKTKDKRRTHLLDCVRYYFNTFHHKFLKYRDS